MHVSSLVSQRVIKTTERRMEFQEEGLVESS